MLLIFEQEYGLPFDNKPAFGDGFPGELNKKKRPQKGAASSGFVMMRFVLIRQPVKTSSDTQ